jgi:hypothetical protein
MLSKRHVVDSIAAIGKQLGRAPSLLEFVRRKDAQEFRDAIFP